MVLQLETHLCLVILNKAGRTCSLLKYEDKDDELDGLTESFL